MIKDKHWPLPEPWNPGASRTWSVENPSQRSYVAKDGAKAVSSAPYTRMVRICILWKITR